MSSSEPYQPTPLPVHRLTWQSGGGTTHVPGGSGSSGGGSWPTRRLALPALPGYIANAHAPSSSAVLGKDAGTAGMVAAVGAFLARVTQLTEVHVGLGPSHAGICGLIFKFDLAKNVRDNISGCLDSVVKVSTGDQKHNVLLQIGAREISVGPLETHLVVQLQPGHVTLAPRDQLGVAMATTMQSLADFLASLATLPPSTALADVDLVGATTLKAHYAPPTLRPPGMRTDLLSIIYSYSANQPDHIALKSTKKEVTYGDLKKEVKTLGGNMRQLMEKHGGNLLKNAPSGKPVLALHLKNSVAFSGAVLAAMEAGCAFLPIPLDMAETRRDFMLRDAGCRAIMVHGEDKDDRKCGEFRKSLPPHDLMASIESSAFGKLDLLLLKDQEPMENVTKLSDDCCYVIYTSGSTGEPKGIACSSSGLKNLADAQIEVLELDTSDTQAQYASISFDATIAESFTTLLSGGTLAAIHSEEKLGQELVDAMKQLRVTVVTFAPSLLNMYKPSQFPTLKKVLAAGEACMVNTADSWVKNADVRIFNAYGPAENTVCATMFKYTKDTVRELGCQELPIGPAIPGVHAYVFDSAMRPVPDGVVGELCVSGKSLSDGYIGKAFEKSKERFVLCPLPGEETKLMYRTGDQVIRTPQGNLLFLGRVDDQIKIRGQMVNLSEVEKVLKQSKDVKHAVVVASQDLQSLYAFVSPASVDLESLRKNVKKSLPCYSNPNKITAIDIEKLPKNVNGKIDRKKLSVNFNDFIHKKKMQMSDEERDVAEIYCEVLNMDREEIENWTEMTTFREIGGNSLELIRLQKHLNDLFKTKFELKDLQSFNDIKSLNTLIRQKQSGMNSKLFSRQLSAIRRQEEKVPSDMEKDLCFNHLVDALEDKESKNILINGVTGFLGAHLLNEIMKQTKSKIYALVRAETKEQAAERVMANLKRYNLWDDSYISRLTYLCSDKSQHLLGLDEQTYDELSKTIHTVIDNAAKMDFNENYESHKASNVDGTKRMLEFVKAGRKKFYFFTSSLAVFLFPDPENVPSNGSRLHFKETDEPVRAEDVCGGYAQSKWVSDRLVVQSLADTAGGAVFRPARVSGQSRSGLSPREDFFASLLQGTQKLGVKPDLDMPFDLVPVDFCAKSMIEIMVKIWSDRYLPRVYHLYNSDTMPLRDLWKNMESLPFNDWMERLSNAPDSNHLKRSMPFFRSEFWTKAVNWPTFGTDNTDMLVSEECKELLKPINEILQTYRNFFSE